MTARLSIVIPAFNEESLLPETLRCLDAALDALGERAEVIVVDNNRPSPAVPLGGPLSLALLGLVSPAR